MRSITIRNARLMSPFNGLHGDVGDIVISGGRFAAIGSDLTPDGYVIDADGLYATPGFIDVHTHVYPESFLGVEPDVLGIERGATTVIDAGSSGSDTYLDFRANHIDKARTKVFTFLNASKEGLLRGHELDDPKKLDVEACMLVAKDNKDNIVGIKARASASVVGSRGLRPIADAADIAHKLGLPLFVHVGNRPPNLGDVLDLLQAGDSITHTFHGKPGGIISENGAIIPQAIAARDRGVRFDVGHGSESFSCDTYRLAASLGFDCDTISTDLHAENYEGPVYSLPAVMSKLMSLGESFDDAVRKVTSAPALQYGLKGLGQFKPGMVGDVNLVSLEDADETVFDSMGIAMQLTKKLTVVGSVCSRNGRSFTHGC